MLANAFNFVTLKILDWTKFKAFANNKEKNITQIMVSLFHWVENTVGKEENAGYLFFRPSHSVSLKLKIVL